MDQQNLDLVASHLPSQRLARYRQSWEEKVRNRANWVDNRGSQIVTNLEHQLGGAFRDAHSAAIAELGFGMPALLQMTAEAGPANAARRILAQPTDTFTKLYLRGRLDLSVEAIVLQEQFQPLFTSDELRLAGERLRESNFQVAEADDLRDREAWSVRARRARSQWGEENPY